MKTSSCKAKGRRCAQEAKDMILRWFPDLEPGDILVTSSGATGEDLIFSPKARAALPLTVECKNVEKLNIWQALKQAESHKQDANHIPTLIFKRNHMEPHIAMRLEDFLRLVGIAEVVK